MLWICGAPQVTACLNRIDHEQLEEDKRSALEAAHALSRIVEKQPSAYAQDYLGGPRRTLSEQKESDALSAIFAGRYAVAVALLHEAEKAEPGRYSVAANLGTAYELNKQDQPALFWISEAFRRNPGSPLRTEWVHVLILKAKLRQRQNPSAAFTPLIELPDDFTDTTVIKTAEGPQKVSEVLRAVHYQLSERMKFVKPRDVYVGDLLHTLARICEHVHGVEPAYEYLKLAELYGAPDQARLAVDKSAYFKRVVMLRFFSGLWWLVKAFTVLVFAFVFLWYPVRRLIRHIRPAASSDQQDASV